MIRLVIMLVCVALPVRAALIDPPRPTRSLALVASPLRTNTISFTFVASTPTAYSWIFWGTNSGGPYNMGSNQVTIIQGTNITVTIVRRKSETPLYFILVAGDTGLQSNEAKWPPPAQPAPERAGDHLGRSAERDRPVEQQFPAVAHGDEPGRHQFRDRPARSGPAVPDGDDQLAGADEQH